MSLQYLLSNDSKFIINVILLTRLLLLTHSTLYLQKQIQIHQGEITDIQFFSDYSKFITASIDKKFIVWNTTSFQVLYNKTLDSSINGIGIHPMTNDIIVLLKNGKVQIYDTNTLTLKISYNYPNSGFGNKITFISYGSMYIMGGFDTGKPPNLHFYDQNHTYLWSIQSKFSFGSQITNIFNTGDTLIFVSSNQETAPVGIEMYAYDPVAKNYILAKQFLQSNAKVRGMSISMDGTNFYSVAQDLTLRNYTASPFNNIYEISSVSYFEENPLAVNAIVPAVTYVSKSSQIVEYFRAGQVSLQSHFITSSPVTQMVNLYPTLICTTSDGKLITYTIQFFDGIDHEMTKWVVLSSVMGSVVFVLLMAMILQIRYNKLKQKSLQQEQQSLKNDKQMVRRNGQFVIKQKQTIDIRDIQC